MISEWSKSTRLKVSGILAVYLIVMGGTASADMSVKCGFGVLTEVYEVLTLCGEDIDAVSRARYAKLNQEFQSFIARNPDSQPDIKIDAEEIRRQLLQDDRDRVCRGRPYELARHVFYHYISDEGLAFTSKLLSKPRDVSEGDCL